MKLHDLRPAPGSNTPRTRVGRGIAAGKGKTAGRGTKGQKARAGGSIPPWFEGGQTPLHMRIPKLRGFKNRFKVVYEVVNLGAIAELVELGTFEAPEPTGKGKAAAGPITINQDILRAAGLVRTLAKPLKVLGTGDLSTPLFVVADAFSKSAIAKIEAAGGSVNVLETPKRPMKALGKDEPAATPSAAPTARAAARPAAEPEPEAGDATPKRGRSRAIAADAIGGATPAAADRTGEASAPQPAADQPDEPPEPADPGADAAGLADAEAPDATSASSSTDEEPELVADAGADSDAPAGDELPTEAADANESDESASGTV
jgi:large subunit ribosomal protein L15